MKKEEQEPANYIDLMSLMVLMVNLHLGAQDNDIGHAHADRSLRDLTRELTKYQDQKNCPVIRLKIKRDTLESCLWSCNMMAEKGQFWSPYQRKKSFTFNDLLKSVLYSNQTYDKFYNRIHTKKKKGVPNGTGTNT